MKTPIFQANIIQPGGPECTLGPTYSSRSMGGLLREIEEDYDLEEGSLRDEQAAIDYFGREHYFGIEFSSITA